MALDNVAEYGAAVDNTDLVNYPQGKVKNDVVPGDNSGTPADKAWLNDIWGFLQKALTAAGLIPSNAPDTAVVSQYMDAMEQLLGGNLYLAGLTLSNNVADAINDLDVAVGEAKDSTGARIMRATSAFTKRLDAVWVAGTGNGGRASGAAALGSAQWWRFFMIFNPSTGAFDFGFDDDPTATNLLSDAAGGGFTLFRRVGWVYRVDGAVGILPFFQVGSDFVADTPQIDRAPGTPYSVATAIPVVLTAPPGSIAKCQLGTVHAATAVAKYVTLKSLKQTNVAPSVTDFNVYMHPGGTSVVSTTTGMGVEVDGSSTVNLRISDAGDSASASISTTGWEDRRAG